jgi:aryl-alcohol dehydrogenase-like predicted oxidoreductase
MASSAGEELVATHLLGGQDRVPRLGYGAMQLAGPGVIGLPEDVTGAIEVLRQAVDQGVRFFDTANAYGPRTVGALGESGALTRPARRLGVVTSAVALAWLLRRSPVMIPIPGTRSLEHLADNIGATEVAAQLTDEEVRALTAVEDEESATLSKMSAQMVDALGRRRRGSETTSRGDTARASRDAAT